MFNDAKGFDEIYIICGFTDLRRGIDGLSTIVQNRCAIVKAFNDYPNFYIKKGKYVSIISD